MKTILRVSLLSMALAVGGCVGGSVDGVIDEEGQGFTARKGVDYSFARPSPSSLKSEGYSFVARYLSYDNSGTHGKILFKAEADALKAAGLDIVSNWEYAADDALNGYNAGVADAKEANAQAAAAGAPPDRPIYFSVDFDATPAQQTPINAYFDGVASVIGRNRTGAYGGYYVIKRAFDAGKITWGWQTYAWSGGQWDARAQFRQTQNGISAGGASGCCDLDNSAADDFGQWGQAPPWKATFVSQSWPLATTAMTLQCGQAIKANIVLKNTGTHAWDTNTKLGTTEPRDRSSRFVGSDWLSASRLSHVTGSVAPGGSFKFAFTFQGPTGAACVPGTYKEYFGVVEEGVHWFSDAGQGGPADNVIEALIKLEPAPPPPDMAHAPGDMAGHPADLAGQPDDLGADGDMGDTTYGPDGGTDDMDTTGEGEGGGNGAGGATTGPNGLQPGKGCSFAGDAPGELPLGFVCIALLLGLRFSTRRRAR